jgi:hypothetical protein
MKSKKTCERSAVLLALAILFSLLGSLPAQSPTGTISGSVTDSTGALVGKATVRITNVQTQEAHTAITNDAGDYLFPSVPTGEYILGAQASGFKQEQRAGIKLDVNQNARVDFALQVGQVNEVVEVKGGATQVDTRSVQLGGTVDTRRVQDLPLDGRNGIRFHGPHAGSDECNHGPGGE